MKRYLILIFFSGFLCTVRAQVTTGLTGKRDTSYSTWSAYKSTLKTHPGIRIVKEQPSKLVKESRNLVYDKISKRSLHIDAFIPVQKKPGKRTPAVLVIHGGGWRSGNRQQHIPLAQRLAAAGYASFTVEYRLSTEALYPAAINDLRSALRWLKANGKKFNVDTNKVAVLGFSAGGELATYVGFKAGDQIQAIIDIDGTLSFVHPDGREGDDRKSISAGTHWFGYSKKDNPKLWAEASPLTYAENNKAPVLFLNSSVTWMHAGRDDFQKIATKNNIYTEVHTFEGAPHSFCLFDPWFEPTVSYITGFLYKIFSRS
jgi:acetyl esterase/lipase